MEHYRPQVGRLPTEKRDRDREDLLRRIPSEDTIKERFKMRIPVRVDAMENPISTIHLMENPGPGIRVIEDHATCIVRDLAQLRKEESVLKTQMADFTKKASDELDQMKSHMMDTFADFWSQLRQNSVEHQNELVPIHKEIQKLRNMKTELIEGLSKEYERVGKVEDTVFRQQIFDLQPNDPELGCPDRHILRREHAHLPNYNPIKDVARAYAISKSKRHDDLFEN